MSKKVLFVCLGNICRSPLAEGIAKAINEKEKLGLIITSSGISARHEGEKPCQDSIRIAKQHKIDISDQRARQVNLSDKDMFDFVIAMDGSNKKDLKKLGFKNVHLLGEFANYHNQDVQDPYYFDSYDDGIHEVYQMIEDCVKDFLKKITN